MQVSRSGSSLLEDWSSFVEECEEGYSWDYAEFLHELQVRCWLDTLAKSPGLATYNEHTSFCTELETIDLRFRALLQRDVRIESSSSWWRSGVLIFAGAPYVAYMAQVHGIRVRTSGNE